MGSPRASAIEVELTRRLNLEDLLRTYPLLAEDPKAGAAPPPSGVLTTGLLRAYVASKIYSMVREELIAPIDILDVRALLQRHVGIDFEKRMAVVSVDMIAEELARA